MLDSFSGKLRLHDGTVVDAVLTIADDTLTVSAEGAEVGTWPLKYCRVSRRSAAEFELSIDGERTLFLPVNEHEFGKVAADRFHGSSIADRINVVRTMPIEPNAEPPPIEEVEVPTAVAAVSERRVPWAVTGVVLTAAALVAIGGWAVGGRSGNDEPVVARPNTTIQAFVADTLFTLTPDGFRQRWNQTVVDRSAQMVIGGRFGTGRFEAALSDQVLLTGGVDGDGTVATIKISIRPTTSPDETAFALATIGLAMEVADPSLSDGDRTRIIRQLGLPGFPSELSLDNVDGEVIENGVRYWLLFIDLEGIDADLLAFGISQAG